MKRIISFLDPLNKDLEREKLFKTKLGIKWIDRAHEYMLHKMIL